MSLILNNHYEKNNKNNNIAIKQVCGMAMWNIIDAFPSRVICTGNIWCLLIALVEHSNWNVIL